MRVLQRALYRFYERRLLRDVAQGPMPRHLGLIQDGHRRYAREVGLSNLGGYRLGATKAEEVLTWCGDLKIPMVTLWSLSTENLTREAVDVSAVLDVIEHTVLGWVQGGLAARLGMRIRPIGKLDLLPDVILGTCSARRLPRATTIACCSTSEWGMAGARRSSMP